MDKIKIGFIGFGNHAKRILNLINKRKETFDLVCFHPFKSSNDLTSDFECIVNCDVVFITSPNDTHFGYIKSLLNSSKCLIFCEKPPCVNLYELEQLQNLDQLNRCRIFFNFNYRFSLLSEIISKYINDNIIGEINYVSAIMSHGLAFKDGYNKTWRGKYSSKKSVVLDTSLVHLLDLFNYLMKGNLKIHSCISSSFSHGIDSFGVSLSNDFGSNISLHATYAAPYLNSVKILGTNGFIEVENNSISIYGPRDTFDISGLFTTPPIIYNTSYSFSFDYINSLQSAVDHFFSIVNLHNKFSDYDYYKSLEAVKLLLECEKKI